MKSIHTITVTGTIGVALGISIGYGVSFATEIATCALLLTIIQSVLYVWERKRRSDAVGITPSFSFALTTLVLSFGIFIGITRVQLIEEKNNIACTGSCTFKGVIIASPIVQGTYQIFRVRPITNERVYDVQIKAPLYPRYTAGETISLFGKVTLPKVSMEHSSIRTFDYSSYLLLHNIGSEMIYPKVTIIDENKDSSSLLSRLEKVKQYFLASIFNYVDEPSASLASGMLFGGSSMSQELVQTFRVAGLSHIVVLSGFNIAVLISFVLLILMFVPLIFRVIIAGVFVTLFVLMVGAEVSIIRASIMAFISLAALLVGRLYTARQALVLSLLIIVLYDPLHLLYDVSLHLSFLATAGIVYASETIKKVLYKVTSPTYKEVIATTLSAYVATLPYVLYTFGTISVYALLTNLIVLPLVPVMMLVTFFVVVTAPLSNLLGIIFGYITTLLGKIIIFVAEKVAALPFSSVQTSISFVTMCFIYLAVILFFVIVLFKKKNETSGTKNDILISEIISY